MDIPWSAYPSPLEEQQGGSRVLAVINKAAVDIHVHISLGIYFSFLQNKYPKMRLLDPLIRIDVLKKKKKKKCQIVSQSGRAIFQPQEQYLGDRCLRFLSSVWGFRYSGGYAVPSLKFSFAFP